MSVRDNLATVRERIACAARNSGRDPSSVRLMAVSKFHPAETVIEAMDAGQTLFGENRVQEATEKFASVRALGRIPELHIIGQLQRNKVAKIVGVASCVQSVDRPELLEEISRHAGARSLVMEVLFEFHTGEESKAGYADTDSLFRSIDLLERMPLVRCRGLMTMAPFTGEQNEIRSSFRTLAKLRDDCAKRYPDLDFSVLSMGMSGDYGIAIEEGSTLVRVGTAIFGERA